jgi:hypothetical protein
MSDLSNLMKSTKKIALILLWFTVFTLPIAFYYAKLSALLPAGPLSNLYQPCIVLLGEPLARLVFCGLWFAMDAALFWRVVFSKRKHEESTPIEGLAD